MALSPIQRDICQLLAEGRRTDGDSYVAGGLALGAALETTRLSRDVDIFHDTTEAVARSWDRDRVRLTAAGYQVVVVRERPGYVEAIVTAGTSTVLIEWTRDSAFRFFPLVEHPDFGLTLHPFDLATSKVLALVGRLEARDWVDVLACDERLQPLGLLAWAACGKDPGFTPQAILAEARRTARYSADEIASLEFAGPAPDARVLSERWRAALQTADAMVDRLPPSHAGEAVMWPDGRLFTGSVEELDGALAADHIVFHRGRILGALPQLRI